MIGAKKEFTFRGKTIEELKKMDIREFAKYLESDARRTILKHFNEIADFVKKCELSKNKPIRTHSRHIIVVPQMIGLVIYVHNGKEFFQVKIIEDMLGHRLGEFSVTRKKVEHGAPGIGATRSSAALSVK